MTNDHKIVGADDKTDPVMIYTPQKIIWGQLVSRKAIKVSTWLQTELAPNYMDIVDAQALIFGAGQSVANQKFQFIHVHKEQIISYHLMPPSDESPYYDLDEPNRKMEPVTILTGIFRFDGFLRMADQSDLKTYLGVQKGLYLPVFDAVMTCPLLPSIKGIQFPFGLVNQSWSVFSGKI